MSGSAKQAQNETPEDPGYDPNMPTDEIVRRLRQLAEWTKGPKLSTLWPIIADRLEALEKIAKGGPS